MLATGVKLSMAYVLTQLGHIAVVFRPSLAYSSATLFVIQRHGPLPLESGFIIEGREREAALVNGAWHDDVMMGLLDHEFLSRKFG